MPAAVLDASAILAVLHGEPGAALVARALPTAVVGAVNYPEVLAKLIEHGAARACLALARRLGLPALTADRRWFRLEAGVDIRLIR